MPPTSPSPRRDPAPVAPPERHEHVHDTGDLSHDVMLPGGVGSIGALPRHGSASAGELLGALRTTIAVIIRNRFPACPIDAANVMPVADVRELAETLREAGPRTAASGHLPDPASAGEARARLAWLSNPRDVDGRVLDGASLRSAIARARADGVAIVSDERARGLGDTDGPVGTQSPSVLDASVSGTDLSGILCLRTIPAKRGTAAANPSFAIGDARLVDALLEPRLRGMATSGAELRDMHAAIGDPGDLWRAWTALQRRRTRLQVAFEHIGFHVVPTGGSFYLWATRAEAAEISADDLRRRGILVVPGTRFGREGHRHIRVTVPPCDGCLAEALRRLSVVQEHDGEDDDHDHAPRTDAVRWIDLTDAYPRNAGAT
jgi:hypothetical protein